MKHSVPRFACLFMVRHRTLPNKVSHTAISLLVVLLAGSISYRKELYGYATDHLGVRSRERKTGSGYLCSARVSPSQGWLRPRPGKTRSQTFECSRKTAHLRNDEEALGRTKESHEGCVN